MGYREGPTQQSSAEMAELNDYEAQLIRRSKRKKIVVWVVFATMLTVGLGSCLGPCAIAIGEEEWRTRHVSLTAAEQKEVDDTLGPMETKAKQSKIAFEAIWPKIKSRDIGARKDLGACRADVPGPRLRAKESARSLEDSAGAYGWTFIDVTPDSERSPLATLKMPRGSMALNNAGTGDRFIFPAAPLKTAPADKVPALASSSLVEDVARFRDESKKLRADGRKNYFDRLHSFAEDGLGIDVIVFVDFWHDPKLTHELAPTPVPKDDDDVFAHPTKKPALLFDPGFTVAHAIAWDPSTQKVVCAAQAVAMSSEHITYRSDQLEPLQQDLVLELERELGNSFVVAGDAPPKLERPPLTISPSPSSSIK